MHFRVLRMLPNALRIQRIKIAFSSDLEKIVTEYRRKKSIEKKSVMQTENLATMERLYYDQCEWLKIIKIILRPLKNGKEYFAIMIRL